jgi:hypothetical protein
VEVVLGDLEVPADLHPVGVDPFEEPAFVLEIPSHPFLSAFGAPD